MPRSRNTGQLVRQGTGARGVMRGWVRLPVEGAERLEFVEQLSLMTGKTPARLCREILAEAIDERSRLLRGSLAQLVPSEDV